MFNAMLVVCFRFIKKHSTSLYRVSKVFYIGIACTLHSMSSLPVNQDAEGLKAAPWWAL